MVTESLRIAAVRPAAPVRSLVRPMALTSLAVAFLAAVSAFAQAPIALPNTITTVAGGASSSGGAITGGVLPAKGAACSAGSPYTATDAFGDGCPGINTMMSGDFRGGLQRSRGGSPGPG